MKLAIDLGSTEFKAAIFADDGKQAGSGAAQLDYVGSDSTVELTPDVIRIAVIAAVKEAVENAGIELNSITAVGVDSQAQTFAIADESLAPRTNFISWLDHRAEGVCADMAIDPLFADFAEHSSIAEISAPMRICLLKHLALNSPELFSEKMRVLPLPSYIIFLLTGEFATDDNIAAMSGLYSLRDRAYREEYLHYVHPRLSRQNLPKVLRMGQPAGVATSDNVFSIAAGTPVYSCGNDQTAGAYGAGLEPGDFLITLGTAQIAYACLDSMPEPTTGLFRGVYPGNLYYAMFAENGGVIISTALKQVPEFGDYAKFAKLAESAPSIISVKCEYDHKNNLLKWSDENASPAEKAKSIFELLTDRMATMTRDLTQVAGDPKNVYITGGGTRRAVWVNMLGEKIGRVPTRVNTSPENGVAKLIR